MSPYSSIFLLSFLILNLRIWGSETRTLFPSLKEDNILEAEESENELSLSPEERLISHLVHQDEELEEEKDRVVMEVKERMEKRRKLVKLPRYLKIREGEEDFQDFNSKNTLARVWFPVEIREMDKEAVIIFQQLQSLETMRDFAKAEIVFTKREDVEIYGTLNLRATMNNGKTENETLHSAVTFAESASRSTQPFHVLNISRLLSFSLESWGTKFLPSLNIGVSISAQLLNFSETINSIISLKPSEIFDLQVERPFIMLTYSEDSVSSTEIEFDEENDEHETRRKRDVNGIGNSSTDPESASEIDQRTPKHLCHRVTWEVDAHDDLEWYDLIGPTRMELGFCAGTCPFPLQNDHFNYTLHTFFKDRHRLQKVFDVPKHFPKSCCVPISYKPTVVWVAEEENSIAKRVFEDVVVDHCGCR